MNTTHAPTTTTSGPLLQPRLHRGRRHLTWLAIFAATVALFYLEENWRGHRDWENCKRELEAKGAKIDWSNFIPPPVPEDQNIFGVPEMQKWFTGRGPTELSKKLDLIGTDLATNSARMVVARLTIGLPGTTPPAGSIVLSWADTNNAKAQTALLIRQALGPLAMDPSGFDLMAKKPEEVRPAQIFLQCQTVPTRTNLLQLRPESVAPLGILYETGINWEKVNLEATGNNSYQVTMYAPIRAADYVAWMEKFEPDLAVVRQALQRPYSRMGGDYSYPPEIPIPNFVTIRAVAQRLSGLARCYLMLGQPEKALDQLTFMHQLCVMLEARPSGKLMTLVQAMSNVAVTGLYVETIQDGLRLQVWQEPQLTALQEQLKEIHLRPYIRDAFALEGIGGCNTVEMTPLAEMGNIFNMGEWSHSGKTRPHPKFSFPFSVIPRGWYYQNMVVVAELHQMWMDDSGLTSASELVEPHTLATFAPALERKLSHWSPFNILAAISIPNFSRAMQTYSHNQTLANQAQIVCALERYHLARGEYPATLEELTPRFIEKIPADLIGGQPPHYHRTADGKFLLYSIGWTEKDHGGQSGSKVSEGDWVWGDGLD